MLARLFLHYVGGEKWPGNEAKTMPRTFTTYKSVLTVALLLQASGIT